MRPFSIDVIGRGLLLYDNKSVRQEESMILLRRRADSLSHFKGLMGYFWLSFIFLPKILAEKMQPPF